MAEEGVSAQRIDFYETKTLVKDVISRLQGQDISALQSYVTNELPGGEGEKKVAVDQAFRDHLQGLITTGAEHVALTSVVALSIAAAQEGLCSPSITFLLLTDIFDSVTIDICDEVFKFVEAKVSVWKQPQFYVSGKNFLLRMSNDLLRRLSKAHDTVFCGRIQLFLAKFFPLDEKSGLNLMSNFNKENVTMYNKESLEGPIHVSQAEEKEDTMDYEEGEMREGSSSVHVDYQLYRKFWALQDYFRDPVQCYTKDKWKQFMKDFEDPVQCYTKDKWKQFMKNTRSVLAAFHSMKLEPDSSSNKSKETANQSTDDKPSVFFAKFLTSEKLFDLQLSDSSFRRYVLVQFLILFQYLSQSVKFKAATLVLTEEMQQFMKTTTDKIYDILKETPPDGHKFTSDIKHVLGREEHWNNWKNEGCPSFVKEKPKEDQEPKRRPRKRTLGEELELNPTSKKIDMGSPELTRLWNQCPNNLEACRAEDRSFLPSMETFFEEAIEQADPDACIEDEYKVVNNSNYAWQALRLLARRSPHFFQTTSIAAQPSIKTIPAYLELMATKLAREMPQLSQVEEIKTEDQDQDELLKAAEDEKEEVVKVSPEDMDLVALKLGNNWKTLAVELGFTEEEISGIQTDFIEVKEQSRHLLKTWEERQGDEASKEVFVNKLTESGLNDIVESVFERQEKQNQESNDD